MVSLSNIKNGVPRLKWCGIEPRTDRFKRNRIFKNLETGSNVCKSLEYDKGDTSNQWERILTWETMRGNMWLFGEKQSGIHYFSRINCKQGNDLEVEIEAVKVLIENI